MLLLYDVLCRHKKTEEMIKIRNKILRNKNRHIGISTLAATFTVVLVLYILGVIGNCHLCTTDKNGIIFLCNRVAYVNQANQNLKLRSNMCVNELVWIWPKQD